MYVEAGNLVRKLVYNFVDTLRNEVVKQITHKGTVGCIV